MVFLGLHGNAVVGVPNLTLVPAQPTLQDKQRAAQRRVFLTAINPCTWPGTRGRRVQEGQHVAVKRTVCQENHLMRAKLVQGAPLICTRGQLARELSSSKTRARCLGSLRCAAIAFEHAVYLQGAIPNNVQGCPQYNVVEPHLPWGLPVHEWDSAWGEVMPVCVWK
jgi:hypothetical protein